MATLDKVEDTQQLSLGRRMVPPGRFRRQQLRQSSHEVPIRVVSGEELSCQCWSRFQECKCQMEEVFIKTSLCIYLVRYKSK